jgi:glycogen(starch) synthase
MNILYLCDEYPPGRHGGIGSAVQLLAREMVKAGHEVVVAGNYDWGYGGEDEFVDEGVRVYRFRRMLDSRWFHKKDSLRVRASYKLLKMAGVFQYDIERSLKKYHHFVEQLIAEHRIDIIEKPDFNEYVQYCTKPTHFPKLSKPTVVKLHGTISYMLIERNIQPDPMLFEMERKVLDTADAICSVSRYTAEKTAEYFRLEKPMGVVYNGIKLKDRLHTAKEPGLVVFAGSLVEKKGIYQLMKAWNLVVKENAGARLVVAGKGKRAEAAAYLDAEVKNNVEFLGHLSQGDLQQLLTKAMVAVLPSFAEAFSLAPMEAMAAGTATIYTKLVSGPEVIADGVDGLLVDPANVKEIAEKILLLLNDGQLREKLEDAGRRKIENEFEIGKIVEKQAAFYRSVLQAKP